MEGQTRGTECQHIPEAVVPFSKGIHEVGKTKSKYFHQSPVATLIGKPQLQYILSTLNCNVPVDPQLQSFLAVSIAAEVGQKYCSNAVVNA